jgi:hypothetical protein
MSMPSPDTRRHQGAALGKEAAGEGAELETECDGIAA